MPPLTVGLVQRGALATRAKVRLPGCVIQPGEDTTEGLPIPTKITFAVAILCPSRGAVRAASAWIINSHQQRVSSRAFCARASGLTCLAEGTYRPKLGSYTRVLAERGRAVLVSKVKNGIWIPLTTARTITHCVGFFTPVLYCGWTDRFITPDHRCDLTPISAPSGRHNANALYPSNRHPLAPFVDGRGRRSRLRWGFTKYLGPQGGRFWGGFGYSHITVKHGWGSADELATRVAIHGRAVSTSRPARGRVRRTYEGPRYRQDGATCTRVVVIDYPAGSGKVGNIITSYGAVVGEPWSNLPSQA